MFRYTYTPLYMKFKIPSIDTLVAQASKTFQRFPLAIIAAIIGTSIAYSLVHEVYSQMPEQEMLLKIMFLCFLGLASFFASTLFGERRGWNQSKILGLQAVIVVLLVGYYFTLPPELFASPEKHIIRMLLLNLAVAFLCMFAAFIWKDEENGLWHFNKEAFIQLVITGIYAVVIFGGISIALATIDYLLGITIDGEVYGDLWCTVMGIFAPWFFLSHIPKDLDALESDTNYPYGLKVFTQYVLLPLVVFYLLILYIYNGKILVTWDWPKGLVSYLILFFSGAGIASLMLIHPLHEDKKYAWMKLFARVFYIAIIPLVGMLFYAIQLRIGDYGITENRYFVVVFGVWLLLMSLYFTFRKKQDLKLIPMSLCVIILLISFGPWGAFAVSENSQTQRLEGYLTKNNILVNGKVQKVDKEAVPLEDQQEISSIIRYLNTVHGLDSIQHWFEEDLMTLGSDEDDIRMKRSSSAWNKPELVMDLMGLDEVLPVPYFDPDGSKHYYFHADTSDEPLPLVGYDYLVQLRGYETRQDRFGDGSYRLYFDNEEGAIEIYKNDDVVDRIDLSDFFLGLTKDRSPHGEPGIPATEMVLEHSFSQGQLKIHFWSMSGSVKGEKAEVHHLEGTVLIDMD